MQSWTQTLVETEDSLRELEESIRHVRTGWLASGANTNGAVGGVSPTPDSQRQLGSELSGILRRCEKLPTEAVSVVESAWANLDANTLPDWDAAGRQVLELLAKQAEAMTQATALVQQGEKSGLPLPSPRQLDGERVHLLDRTRDFLDSWPWSTGNKPGDEEDAAAARRAIQALPSFEELSRLAERFPPPPEWWNGE
jgi:hypothetical protein